MLSFGYSNPPPQRSAGATVSKYSLPTGLSFNIFKAPMLSSFPYSNFNAAHSPPPPPEYPPNAQNSRRKPSPPTSSNLYPRTYRTSIPVMYEHVDGNQQRAMRHYGIHASTTNNVLIYETSAPSNSNSGSVTQSARSSSTASEPFTVTDSTVSSVDDVSSTMASSSTETLQNTLIVPANLRTVQEPNALYTPSLRVPDECTPPHDHPFSQLSQPKRQANSSKLSAQLDINNPISNGQVATRVPLPDSESAGRATSRIDRRDSTHRPPTSDAIHMSHGQVANRVSLPDPDPIGHATSRIDRRNSTSRHPTLDASLRVTVQDYPSSDSSSSTIIEDAILSESPPPRPLPPIPENLQDRHGQPGIRKHRSDREVAEGNDHREGKRDTSGYPSKSSESRPIVRAVSTNSMPLSLKHEFPRRSVRWKEELVCPSPLPRRKGWFNRRGDQLWTNDKLYKPAEAGAEFPDDLADYPDPGSGWMNEMGVRIDMDHHLIPPRSALKHHHPSRRATA